ncbi:HNH endonuclease [uncultured Corynebacterium sp.]|uniref:HNH endonuclease n=1 Tax=uncultured Corynebacterium sp. TaxID=159447 RepID=UPI0025DA8196|nr:HNH endonuclease signature motif containing protein [uncultured Corynebacterium sp.]
MTRWGGRRIAALRGQVLATHGTVCHLCGMPGATSIDHIIPRAAGGTDDLDNLRPAHVSCNSSRQDQPLIEWRRRHPLPDRAPPSRDW